MPLKPIEGPIVDWKGKIDNTTRTSQTQGVDKPLSPDDDLIEKIIERNNLLKVAFLERGVQVARSVGHIAMDRGVATGFLVADDVLMTNNHVFGDAEEAQGAVVKFNFQDGLDGQPMTTDDYEIDPDDFFWTDADLDCTVVRVKRSPGSTWGVIPIPRSAPVRVNDQVVIVQHPAGRPKEIALSDNEVAFVNDDVIQYLTDTEPGSSGSPVFDISWKLVGLHHSGGWIPEPNSQSTHFRNEGIRISAIRKKLPSWD
jgi:V8-like Glu-specific endopeptidase